MTIKDEDIANRLDMSPQPKEVINELFERAKGTSEERFFCSIVDLERTIHNGKSFRSCMIIRHEVIQQFADYFNNIIAISKNDMQNSQDSDFLRRLQMLAYSQLWECLGIQRLLGQLINIIIGREYVPRLFLDKHLSTYKLFNSFQKDAKTENLKVSDFLQAVYYNKIRNAFVHSEFWFINEYIDFPNNDQLTSSNIHAIRINTWDKLFTLTTNFVIELFKARRQAEIELQSQIPYRIELNEFLCPFYLKKYDTGDWYTEPTL